MVISTCTEPIINQRTNMLQLACAHSLPSLLQAEMVVRHIEKDIALQLRTHDNAQLAEAYGNVRGALSSCFQGHGRVGGSVGAAAGGELN